jgi:hypothetical protein
MKHSYFLLAKFGPIAIKVTRFSILFLIENFWIISDLLDKLVVFNHFEFSLIVFHFETESKNSPRGKAVNCGNHECYNVRFFAAQGRKNESTYTDE